MSKITELIPGYADMTEDQKIVAIEAFEIEDNKTTDRLKAALSKANSEAADYKRKLNEKLSEAERAEAERAEQAASMQKELEELRREKTVSGYKAQYLELGYDADLASKTAEALADGDNATVFANQKLFIANKMKQAEAESVRNQPELTSGSTPTAVNITKADFLSMGYTERAKLAQDNPDLYKQLNE